jgi:hypothetical protein
MKSQDMATTNSNNGHTLQKKLGILMTSVPRIFVQQGPDLVLSYDSRVIHIFMAAL